MIFYLKIMLTVCILLLAATVFSQTANEDIPKQDSTAKKVIAYAARQFAVARPLNIEFTNISPYSYSSQQGNTDLPESKITRFSQVRASANFNFVRKKSWLFGATLGYRYTNTATNLAQPVTGTIKAVNEDFHNHYTSFNFTYFSRLFKKTIIYTSNLMVDGSEKHFERVKGLIGGTMVLKVNANTKMTVGMLANIDPSSQVPLIPVFSYEHKLNKGFTADIILPKQVLLRKLVFDKGRLSMGTELDGTGFYLYNLNPSNISQEYEYRQIDLNNGLIYEHLLGNSFVLTARTGLRATMNSQIFEKEGKFSDPVFETSPNPAFYFNAGLSFNPFIKAKKK